MLAGSLATHITSPSGQHRYHHRRRDPGCGPSEIALASGATAVLLAPPGRANVDPAAPRATDRVHPRVHERVVRCLPRELTPESHGVRPELRSGSALRGMAGPLDARSSATVVPGIDSR